MRKFLILLIVFILVSFAAWASGFGYDAVVIGALCATCTVGGMRLEKMRLFQTNNTLPKPRGPSYRVPLRKWADSPFVGFDCWLIYSTDLADMAEIHRIVAERNERLKLCRVLAEQPYPEFRGTWMISVYTLYSQRRPRMAGDDFIRSAVEAAVDDIAEQLVRELGLSRVLIRHGDDLRELDAGDLPERLDEPYKVLQATVGQSMSA